MKNRAIQREIGKSTRLHEIKYSKYKRVYFKPQPDEKERTSFRTLSKEEIEAYRQELLETAKNVMKNHKEIFDQLK